MKIVIVSSELAPFSKTGGLGDVCGALGPTLVRRGHQVVTVSPKHGSIDPRDLAAEDTGIEVGLYGAGAMHRVRFFRARRDGVDHLLVDHPMFHRTGVYGDANGTFRDNHLRFSILSRAAIEAARRVPVGDGAPIGEDVVFHVHDWPTALLPLYLEAHYRPLGLMTTASTVLTIHNLAHQGRVVADVFPDLELAPRWLSPEGLEWFGDLGMLKAGLLQADQITTVSPTYAKDILGPDHGFGLDSVLRYRRADLTGILNGIDTTEWDPASDAHITVPYSADDLAGKAACKAALQAELGLPVDPDVPLVGAVGRLDPQKGVELLIDVVPTMIREYNAQFVIVGSAVAAHQHYENRLRELQWTWPKNVCSWIGFSERIAHRVEAGADLFAMPSLFEPCGLNQMYSMRYGTIPVVRATGGLADSVVPVDILRDLGTGFTFPWFDAQSLAEALRHALWVWRERPDDFRQIQQRGMRRDASWNAVIPAYEAVYERAIARRRAQL